MDLWRIHKKNKKEENNRPMNASKQSFSRGNYQIKFDEYLLMIISKILNLNVIVFITGCFDLCYMTGCKVVL